MQVTGFEKLELHLGKAGFVLKPEHWQFSSAIDYTGGKGLLEIRFVE